MKKLIMLFCFGALFLFPISVKAQTQDVTPDKPTLFAPDVVSRGAMEFAISFSENQRSAFFTSGNASWTQLAICVVSKVGNNWGQPELLPFSGKYLDADPFLVNDTRLYFISDRPVNNQPYKRSAYKIWYVEKENNQNWNSPKLLEGPFNTLDLITYPSLTKKGNLYFTSRQNNKSVLFVSHFEKGSYQAPEILSFVKQGINYQDAVVSPDERFIIFSSNLEGGSGAMDLWVSIMRNEQWSEPVNLGTVINSNGSDGQPSLSPDGKTLYYSYGGRSAKPEFKNYEEYYNSLVSAGNGFLDIYSVSLEGIDILKSF